MVIIPMMKPAVRISIVNGKITGKLLVVMQMKVNGHAMVLLHMVAINVVKELHFKACMI